MVRTAFSFLLQLIDCPTTFPKGSLTSIIQKFNLNNPGNLRHTDLENESSRFQQRNRPGSNSIRKDIAGPLQIIRSGVFFLTFWFFEIAIGKDPNIKIVYMLLILSDELDYTISKVIEWLEPISKPHQDLQTWILTLACVAKKVT